MTFEEYQRQAESFKTPSANNLEYTLEQLAELNIAKLSSRKARGVIKGNGDER